MRNEWLLFGGVGSHRGACFSALHPTWLSVHETTPPHKGTESQVRNACVGGSLNAKVSLLSAAGPCNLGQDIEHPGGSVFHVWKMEQRCRERSSLLEYLWRMQRTVERYLANNQCYQVTEPSAPGRLNPSMLLMEPFQLLSYSCKKLAVFLTWLSKTSVSLQREE